MGEQRSAENLEKLMLPRGHPPRPVGVAKPGGGP